MAAHLIKNGPPEATYRCFDNGWITEDLFVEWLQHFECFTKPSKEDPVLLILDNHSSHCSLTAYNFCKAKGIEMLTIPSHTSHRIQPLDGTFYGPLKAALILNVTNLCGHIREAKLRQMMLLSSLTKLWTS